MNAEPPLMHKPEPSAPSAVPAPHPSPIKCIPSEQLLAGSTEVQIDHGGVIYRLKKTSLGKLILTK